MRSSLLAVVLVCLVLPACNRGQTGQVGQQSPQPSGKAAVDSDLVVGEPIQFENLTVFPVTSKTERNQDRFITLDEGLKSGTVEILELGAAAGPGSSSVPNAQPAENAPEAPAENAPRAPVESTPPPAAEGNADPAPSAAVPNTEAPNADAPRTDVPSDDAPNAAAADAAAAEAEAPNQEPAQSQEGDSTGSLIQASDFEGLAPAPRPKAEDAGQQDAGQQDNRPQPDFPPAEAPGEGGAAEPFEAPPLANGGEQLAPQLPGGGDDVNKLMVVNRSDRPLYLMPGEVIVGGSQDRTIGQELVIAPDGKPVPIDVFCVEHGRWGGRESDETAGLLQMATENAANAGSVALGAEVSRATADSGAALPQGKFVGSVGNVSKGARLAVQQLGDQSEVWKEVAKTNAKSGVQTDSGAFTHNYVNEAAVKRLEPYIEKLQGKVDKTPRVVGVIVAIDGKLESIDVFESTPLFRKLWPKLLKSFALDAVNASDGKIAVKACTRDDAVAFFNDAAKAEVKKSESKQGVMLVHRDSDRIATFSASAASGEAQADSAAAGGFGGAVHASAFAK